jgi:hypothetical protein
LISDPPGVKPRLRPVDGDYTVPDGRTFNLCREHHDQAVVLYADPERDRQRTAARWENRHPTAVTAILWIVMPIEYAVIAAFWLGPPIVTVRFFSQLPVGYGIAAALGWGSSSRPSSTSPSAFGGGADDEHREPPGTRQYHYPRRPTIGMSGRWYRCCSSLDLLAITAPIRGPSPDL